MRYPIAFCFDRQAAGLEKPLFGLLQSRFYWDQDRLRLRVARDFSVAPARVGLACIGGPRARALMALNNPPGQILDVANCTWNPATEALTLAYRVP